MPVMVRSGKLRFALMRNGKVRSVDVRLGLAV